MRQAESLRVRKFKRPFDQKTFDKEKKEKLEYLDPRVVKYEEKSFFHSNESQNFEGGTFETILSEAEINLCAYRLLTNMQLKNGAKESAKILPVSIFPPLADEALVFYLLKHEYISEIVPLHSRSCHKDNYKPLFDKVMKSYSAPTEDIRKYYGESIAIYFEWCNFMAKWLLIPSIFAVALYIHEKIYGLTSDSATYNGYYSFAIAVWAPLLVIFWRRRCSELDVEWDNYNLTVSKTNLRQQFVGEERTNPITDKQEYHYSTNKRMMRYVESFIIATPFIAAALFVMLGCLNMMGYSDQDDFFYMKFFADLSLEGGFFEKGSLMAFIPSIIMTGTMTAISKVYEPMAEVATKRENHKTKEDHLNSMNIKKFIFNFIFFFSHLFYVAFERQDLAGLRKELITLALVEEIRRICTESALPSFLRYGIHIDRKYNSIVEEQLDELTRPEYTYFEDYLELVIQYGYVAMFSAAFPLGTVISYVFLFFERRSDAYKIEKLCRRPLSWSTSDIGIWDDIMVILSYMAVFTNLFLFAFASSHIDGMDYTPVNKCQNSFYFITIEHFLIVVIVLMRACISDRPKWVNTFLKRVDENLRKRTILQSALSKIKSANVKIKAAGWIQGGK